MRLALLFITRLGGCTDVSSPPAMLQPAMLCSEGGGYSREIQSVLSSLSERTRIRWWEVSTESCSYIAYGYGPVQTRLGTYTLPDIQSSMSFARSGDLSAMESWAADFVPLRWRERETIGRLTREGACVVGELGEGRRVACDDAGLDDDDAGLVVLERMLWEGRPVISTVVRLELHQRLPADSSAAAEMRGLLPVLSWPAELPPAAEMTVDETRVLRDEAAVAFLEVRLQAHQANVDRRVYYDEVWVEDSDHVFAVSFVDDFVEGTVLEIEEVANSAYSRPPDQSW